MFKCSNTGVEEKAEKGWLLFLALIAFALISKCSFADEAPSLREVLANEPLKTFPDFSMMITVALGCALVAFSAVKTYGLLKRSEPVAVALLPEDIESVPETSVAADAGEAERVREEWALENAELQDKLKRLEASLRETEQVEKLLRKSNISLSRECERLKTENEARALKSNTISMKASRLRPKAKKKPTRSVKTRKRSAAK